MHCSILQDNYQKDQYDFRMEDGRICRQDDLNRVQQKTKNMTSHNIQPSPPAVVPATSTSSEVNQLLAMMSDLLRQNAFLVERVNANQAAPTNHYSVLAKVTRWVRRKTRTLKHLSYEP